MRKNVYPKGKGFWNVARIRRAAKKFKYRYEWRKDKSYDAAKRFRVVNDKNISGHLLNIRPTRRNWSNKEIIKIARKFKYKEEWRKNHYSSYQASIKQRIFPLATKHMHLMGSHYYRCLYSIKIKREKKIYIGLTYNFNQRIKDHLKTKRFCKYKRNSLIIKKMSGYIHKEKAAALEIKLMKEMKNKNYILLNTKVGGGLGGGTRKWTKLEVMKSAKKFNQVSRWKEAEVGAVIAATKGGYYKEATRHMKRLWKFKWTKEKVLKDALKYKTRTEWVKNSNGAYWRANRQGWSREATKHMVDGNIFWTKDKVLKEALKYKKRIDFQKKSSGACGAAKRLGCYKEATSHMKKYINQYDYRTTN